MSLTGRRGGRQVPPPSEPGGETPAEPPAAPISTPLDPNANTALPKAGR
jgi:hypothetical protein